MNRRAGTFFTALLWSVTLLAVSFACSEGRRFPEAFHQAVLAAASRPEPNVKVSSVTDFEWDRLFIFGPYTPVETIHEQLGYKWPEAEKSQIHAADTFSLLVFVKKGTVVRHFKYYRNLGDFQNLEAQNNVFSFGDDAFEVRRLPSSTGSGRLNFHPKRKDATPTATGNNAAK